MAPTTNLTKKMYAASAAMAVVAGILAPIAWDLLCWTPWWHLVLGLLLGLVSCLTLAASLLIWYVAALNPADSHQKASLKVQFMVNKFIPLRRGRQAFRTLISKAQNCHRAQEELLLQIIMQHEATAYGLDHRFKEMKSTEDYLKLHPLTTYADYSDYIERTLAGEDNAMLADPVVHVATSSGTTGKNKLFPVTANLGGTALGHLYLTMAKKRNDLPLGRYLGLRYKPQLSKTSTGINIGPVSYYTAPYSPYFITPKAGFQIEREDAALYVHALFGLAERYVVTIDGLMSTLVFAFFRQIEKYWENLCDDLEKGTLREDICIDEEIRRQLINSLEPNPSRAEELRVEFKGGFDGIAKRIWPDVRVISMLSTGSFAAQTKLLMNSYTRGLNVSCLVHGASEGLVGLALSEDVHSEAFTTLPHTGSFLEFIEESHIQEENPPTLLMEQVQRGKNYEVVITNAYGLYRYRLGDVIKVVGFFHQCPTYEFQYRVGQMLNLAWEKTPENIFYAAVEDAVEQLPEGVHLIDYTAMENFVWEEASGESIGSKCYVLLIELLHHNQAYRLSEEEKKLFDQHLRNKFELYDQLRKNASISCMHVKEVRPAGFLALKYEMIRDTGNQQFKMPRVLRNVRHVRTIMKELI